jgi:hypothetical protein
LRSAAQEAACACESLAGAEGHLMGAARGEGFLSCGLARRARCCPPCLAVPAVCLRPAHQRILYPERGWQWESRRSGEACMGNEGSAAREVMIHVHLSHGSAHTFRTNDRLIGRPKNAASGKHTHIQLAPPTRQTLPTTITHSRTCPKVRGDWALHPWAPPPSSTPASSLPPPSHPSPPASCPAWTPGRAALAPPRGTAALAAGCTRPACRTRRHFQTEFKCGSWIARLHSARHQQLHDALPSPFPPLAWKRNTHPSSARPHSAPRPPTTTVPRCPAPPHLFAMHAPACHISCLNSGKRNLGEMPSATSRACTAAMLP